MDKMINKNALAKELAKRLDCTNVLSKKIIHEYNELIMDKLLEGYAVKIQYFGVFSLNQRAEYLGRNPRTGEQCIVEKQNSMKFKPSEYVINRINKKNKI